MTVLGHDDVWDRDRCDVIPPDHGDSAEHAVVERRDHGDLIDMRDLRHVVRRINAGRKLIAAFDTPRRDEFVDGLGARAGPFAVSSHEVVARLREHIPANGTSCRMVKHDDRILNLADRIMSLADGRIISDVMVREQVVLCEMLSEIELFGSLNPGESNEVAGKMEGRRIAPGHVLIRQGETGTRFFLPRTGTVDVHLADPERSQIVATLEPGRYFGGRALVAGEVRDATIVGRSEGYGHVLERTRFDAAIAAAPTLQQRLRHADFARQ